MSKHLKDPQKILDPRGLKTQYTEGEQLKLDINKSTSPGPTIASALTTVKLVRPIQHPPKGENIYHYFKTK